MLACRQVTLKYDACSRIPSNPCQVPCSYLQSPSKGCQMLRAVGCSGTFPLDVQCFVDRLGQGRRNPPLGMTVGPTNCFCCQQFSKRFVPARNCFPTVILTAGTSLCNHPRKPPFDPLPLTRIPGGPQPFLCALPGALFPPVPFPVPRYIVSASDDKTVRVWDVETGLTRRVLREASEHSLALFARAARLSPGTAMSTSLRGLLRQRGALEETAE